MIVAILLGALVGRLLRYRLVWWLLLVGAVVYVTPLLLRAWF